MDKDGLFELVAEERLALCDQLDGLTDEQWDTPSLCEGWRVREVLAHLVTLQEIPTWKFMVGAFGMRGFHRKVDTFAKAYGERDPAELVESYRDLATSRMAPPVIGPIAPLTDIVVHSLDIQRPLELPATSSTAATLLALEALCGGFPGFTGKKLVGDLRFEATDLDWSLGEGPAVEGTSADLLLGVMGRAAAAQNLVGDGADTLRTRL